MDGPFQTGIATNDGEYPFFVLGGSRSTTTINPIGWCDTGKFFVTIHGGLTSGSRHNNNNDRYQSVEWIILWELGLGFVCQGSQKVGIHFRRQKNATVGRVACYRMGGVWLITGPSDDVERQKKKESKWVCNKHNNFTSFSLWSVIYCMTGGDLLVASTSLLWSRLTLSWHRRLPRVISLHCFMLTTSTRIYRQ